LIKRTFQWSVIPDGWRERKGSSVLSRLIWSFIAGFLMIIGARLAGGCTSGHFMSGMSQLAISSILFGAVVLSSLLLTGYLFYPTKKAE